MVTSQGRFEVLPLPCTTLHATFILIKQWTGFEEDGASKGPSTSNQAPASVANARCVGCLTLPDAASCALEYFAIEFAPVRVGTLEIKREGIGE